MCDSNGFFVGISPTSKGFAIGKKIRYDRRNERMLSVEGWDSKVFPLMGPFSSFFPVL